LNALGRGDYDGASAAAEKKPMTTTFRLLPWLVAGFAATAFCQGEGAPAAATKKTLTEADVKTLSDLLTDMFPVTERDGKEIRVDYRKKEKATEDFKKEIERLKVDLGPGLVSDFSGWGEIFQRYRVANGVKNASGFGYPQEIKVPVTSRLTKLEYAYSVVLPLGYDVRKRYPAVVCLHDSSDSDRDFVGSKYLSEVHLKAPRDVKDQFILIAPNLGPRAAGKDVRIEFGDDNQLLGVLYPLFDALQRFAIDADRVSLEGTGRGGELAALLASYRPQQWASVVIRNAVPRDVALFGNAKLVPTSFHLREEGPLAGAKETLDKLEAMKAAGAPFSFVKYPALSKSQESRARVGMATDPIAEATQPALEFALDKKRDYAPKNVEFSVDNHRFRQMYWVRVERFDSTKEDPARISVSVDATNNVVKVTAKKIEEFRLLLSDAVVDLGRPVKVEVNGKQLLDSMFDRSFDAFFENWTYMKVDPGVVPCAQADLAVPPPEAPNAGSPADPNAPTDPNAPAKDAPEGKSGV
jgi:pimeloyl-ACP methyl ester carboxylesterase